GMGGYWAPVAGGGWPGAISLLAAVQWQGTPAALASAAAFPVGGPLYPPVHALLMWPLGYLRPLPAYHTFQVLGILLAFLTGWCVRLLSKGRIWWPIAATAVLAFPGFSNSLNLGQNSFVTLAI